MATTTNSLGSTLTNYTYRTVAEESCSPNDSYFFSLSDAQSYMYPEGQIFLVTILLPIIFCIGIISNFAFIYVVIRIKHMRTITNKYLLNLAIADVVFLATAIGDKLWKYKGSPIMGDDRPLGLFGCILVYFVSDMAYFVSLFFVTIVSLDRFLAVCRPQDRKNAIKGKSTEIIIGSWILSCILAGLLIPANAGFQSYCIFWPEVGIFINWPVGFSSCVAVKDWFGDFATGVQTIPFFVTLVLNVYLYVSIVRGLDKCIKRMNQHGVANRKDTRMRRQIARMLVVNGVTFFCSLAPFELMSLFQLIASLRPQESSDYSYIIVNSTVRSYMMLLARTFSYINSAINPLIYTAMCRRYLEAFKHAFLPMSCRNKFDQDLRVTESRCLSTLVPTQTEETKLNAEINDTNV